MIGGYGEVGRQLYPVAQVVSFLGRDRGVL